MTGRPLSERLADLPLMPEGILQPTEQPAMLLAYWRDLRGTESDRLLEYGLGILDDEQDPHGAASE